MAALQNLRSRRPVAANPSRGSDGTGASTERGFWWRIAQMRPGVNAVRAGLALFVLSFAHFAFPSSVLLAVMVLLWSSLLLASVLEARKLSRQMSHLAVRRTTPTVVGRDAAFSLSWEIENSGDDDLKGELREVVSNATSPRFALHPFEVAGRGGRARAAQACRIVERGLHTFGPIWIRLFGTNRLVELQRPFDLPARLKVLPEQFASREELLKDRGAELLLLDKATRTRQHGAGTEFESLTEFRDGDDPRRIDWRTTARVQRPVVRRFQIERHRDVVILLDTGRLMGSDTGHGSKLDCAVDASLILARVALQSGDRCGIGLYDNEVRGYLPPMSESRRSMPWSIASMPCSRSFASQTSSRCSRCCRRDSRSGR